jgi:MtN3 and saliva related transmembrane protein
MDFVDVLGFSAATLTTVAFLPQLIKTWQSKSAKDVSLEMLIAFSTGVFLWLVYGIFIEAWPVIFANSLTLVFNLSILFLKIKYQ